MKLITIEDIKNDYQMSTGDINIKNKGAYILYLEKNYLQVMNEWMKSTRDRQLSMSNLGQAIADLTGGLTKHVKDATDTVTKAGGPKTYKNREDPV